MDTLIQWSPKLLEELIDAYKRTPGDNNAEVAFKNRRFHKHYANYLIAHLSKHFNLENPVGTIPRDQVYSAIQAAEQQEAQKSTDGIRSLEERVAMLQKQAEAPTPAPVESTIAVDPPAPAPVEIVPAVAPDDSAAVAAAKPVGQAPKFKLNLEKK